MPSSANITVVDVLTPSQPPSRVEIDDPSTATVGELRALIMSLPLDSVHAARSGGFPRVCHDGRVLEDDDETLDRLGVLDAPVVVVFGSGPHRRAPPQPLFTAASVTGAASAAASAVAGAAAGAVAPLPLWRFPPRHLSSHIAGQKP